jgi:ankyrin repeat protein
MLAAQRGDEDAVNLLLASGAATLARNKEGFTARDLAFRNGHAGVVAVLDKASAITQ